MSEYRLKVPHIPTNISIVHCYCNHELNRYPKIVWNFPYSYIIFNLDTGKLMQEVNQYTINTFVLC